MPPVSVDGCGRVKRGGACVRAFMRTHTNVVATVALLGRVWILLGFLPLLLGPGTSCHRKRHRPESRLSKGGAPPGCTMAMDGGGGGDYMRRCGTPRARFHLGDDNVWPTPTHFLPGPSRPCRPLTGVSSLPGRIPLTCDTDCGCSAGTGPSRCSVRKASGPCSISAAVPVASSRPLSSPRKPSPSAQSQKTATSQRAGNSSSP